MIADWMSLHTELLTALGTIALALFGALQIGLEFSRRLSARKEAKAALLGPAWLARRSLEAALFEAVGKKSAREWFDAAGTSQHLNPLETHLLNTISFASIAGRATATTLKTTFEAFLSYADHINHIGTVRGTVRDDQGFVVNYTDEQRSEINASARKAISHLRTAIEELATVVPRRITEPSLPPDSDIPLLSGSPDPN